MKKPTKLGLLATAIASALLLTACGDGSTEAYTPSYPDQDSYNQEADSDTSYDNDYDYTDYDYADAAPVLEVGSVLSPEEAESTRAYLRAMDNETRAGRVVINRNGEWIVGDLDSLVPGDELHTTEDRAFVRMAGVPVFHGPNDDDVPFVFDARNPGSVITNVLGELGRETTPGDPDRNEMILRFFYGERETGEAMTVFENTSFAFLFPTRDGINPTTRERRWGFGGENTEAVGLELLTDIMQANGLDGTQEGLESALRRIARSNPNIVVIGFDGERITG